MTGLGILDAYWVGLVMEAWFWNLNRHWDEHNQSGPFYALVCQEQIMIRVEGQRSFTSMNILPLF